MTPEQLKTFERSYVVPSDIESDPVGAFNDMQTLISALEYALSQAEANRVDAERLTWVSENLVGVRETMVSEIEIVYFDAKGAKQIARGLTLRAAIDAARLTNAVKTKG